MTNSIIEEEKMSMGRFNPRIAYLKRITSPIPDTCPECDSPLEDHEYETICTHCGLVTSTTIEYVAGQKIILPYGRHS